MKKKWLILCLFLGLLMITGCDKNNNNNKTTGESENNVQTAPNNEPQVQIVDINSSSRPVAIMINNINAARGVQTGLSKAYIIYEIIVEGGITRYLALFKDADVPNIGSVRSARHYYLDYVLENDAIFVHWGASYIAEQDLKDLKIDYINQMENQKYDGAKYFYREQGLNVESTHTGFTKMESINKAIKDLNYRTEAKKALLLNYSAVSLDLEKYNAEDANNVTVKYSGSTNNEYVYDANSKMYLRYVNNKAQNDRLTSEQLAVKNIIIYEVDNVSIKNDDKGRQNLNNIGSGSGYFITEGKAVKINWSKKNRESQTIYTYEDGTEIIVNDGLTFIQLVPTTGKVTVK